MAHAAMVAPASTASWPSTPAGPETGAPLSASVVVRFTHGAIEPQPVWTPSPDSDWDAYYGPVGRASVRP